MSVILKGIFGLEIFDLERADEIISDCDIDISFFKIFLERKITERNIDHGDIDIIGLLYEYILAEAKSEVYELIGKEITQNITVSANYLATSYDYVLSDYGGIQRILRSTFEYETSLLLQFFVEKIS